MGRPPIKKDAKVTKRTLWLHDDLFDRTVARVGKQGMSGYVRALIEADEARIERLAKRKALKPPQ